MSLRRPKPSSLLQLELGNVMKPTAGGSKRRVRRQKERRSGAMKTQPPPLTPSKKKTTKWILHRIHGNSTKMRSLFPFYDEVRDRGPLKAR